jgi:hypothetical protein
LSEKWSVKRNKVRERITVSSKPAKKHDRPIVVNCVLCPGCGALIYSMSVHHYHHCLCGGVMVDGGFEYLRMGYGETKQGTILEKKMKRQMPDTVSVALTKDQFYSFGGTIGGHHEV